jgi:hypothetical protein
MVNYSMSDTSEVILASDFCTDSKFLADSGIEGSDKSVGFFMHYSYL